MYLAGVSVRRVEDISEALWGSKVSAPTISKLNKKAYIHIEEWRNRALKGKFPYVKVEDNIGETLTFMDFLYQHWLKICTNNVIERMNREVRRRTRVVGDFPDGNSVLMFVRARLRYVAGKNWGSNRYLCIKCMGCASEH